MIKVQLNIVNYQTFLSRLNSLTWISAATLRIQELFFESNKKNTQVMILEQLNGVVIPKVLLGLCC